MTIHHDKLAYGKLASTKEDMSDKDIEDMLKELNNQEAEADKTLKKAEKNNKIIKKL